MTLREREQPERLFLEAQLQRLEELKEMAEERARAAMAALHRVARDLVPGAYDEARRDGNLPPTPEELASFVVEKVQARIFALEIKGRAARIDPQEVERLQEELRRAQEWKEKAETLEGEMALLRARLEAKEKEAADLRKRLAQLEEELQRASAGAAAPSPVSFEAGEVSVDGLSAEALAALRVLGETGACLRRPVTERLLAEGVLAQESVKPFQELERAGLLEQHKPKVESVGNTPYLLRLTEAGLRVYRQRFGGEPADPLLDVLLRRHKSIEHVWLNLKAAQVLEDFGYAVDLVPSPVRTEDGHEIAPDLAATKEGRTIYVECERTAKRGEAFAQKVENMLRLNGDALYFVVPDTAMQSTVISLVGEWAYRERRPVTLHVCNLAKVDQGGDEPWTVVRRIG